MHGRRLSKPSGLFPPMCSVRGCGWPSWRRCNLSGRGPHHPFVAQDGAPRRCALRHLFVVCPAERRAFPVALQAPHFLPVVSDLGRRHELALLDTRGLPRGGRSLFGRGAQGQAERHPRADARSPAEAPSHRSPPPERAAPRIPSGHRCELCNGNATATPGLVPFDARRDAVAVFKPWGGLVARAGARAAREGLRPRSEGGSLCNPRSDCGTLL